MANDSLEEQKSHSSILIPHSFYRGAIPEYYPEIGAHWHQEYEIIMILEGSCLITCGKQEFFVRQGDLMIFQPNMLHAVRQNGEEHAMFDIIVFHPRLLTGGMEDRAFLEMFQPMMSGKTKIKMPITKKHPYHEAICSMFRNACNCAVFDTGLHDLLLKSELLQLFWLLFESGSVYEEIQQEQDICERFAPVVRYIESHYTEELTVDELAAIAHLSRSYFMITFKKVMGMPVMEYVDEVRMKHVCRLLHHTDRSITEIAGQCGFRNLSNFNRRFLRAFGITPREYRKAAKAGNPENDAKPIIRDNIYEIMLNPAYEALLRKAGDPHKLKPQVDQIICWMTGYTQEELEQCLTIPMSYQDFIEHAPRIHPNCSKIKGVVSGMRVELIEETLMQKMRWLDKLVDELSKGVPMEEILRK